MRHLRKGRKFHRKRGQRRSFVGGLAANLIMKEKISTTEARAKEIRGLVEKLVTIAKKQTLGAFRLLRARIRSKSAAEKLYYEIAPRYKERNGGYTRIVKTAKTRKRDSAAMAIIEFV